jgi:hypothetical protein
MTLTSSQAQASLDDIERIVRRVKQSSIYRNASLLLMLWGAIVMVGYVGCEVAPRYAATVWLICQAGGLLVTIALSARFARDEEYRVDARIVGAVLLFFGFGLLWSQVFGHFSPRGLNAFWATLFMFGYAVAGIWLGRAFVILGLTVTALTVVGYLWVGPWFNLYMAVVDGGGLVLCGLWMRRA